MELPVCPLVSITSWPFTGDPWDQAGSIFMNPSHSGIWTHWQDPPQAFASWGSTISALSFSKAHTKVCQTLQYFNQLSDSSMDSLHYAHVSLVQGGAELGTALQLQYHQDWVDRKDAFSQPAGSTLRNASQEAVGLCCKGTSLAHVQLLHQSTQVLFSKAVFQPVLPKSVLVQI